MKRSRSGTSKRTPTSAQTCVDSLISVFTAAATSIKVKLYNDDDDEDSVSLPLVQTRAILTACRQDTPQPSSSSTPLDRTSTGIISNKPQKIGLSALTAAASDVTGLSVMALAKRESARRCLYSRFFRGPVLGPDSEEPQVLEAVQHSPSSRSEMSGPKSGASILEKRKGEKPKSREEEVVIAQKRPKLKREARRSRKKARVSELRPHGEVGAGLTKVLTTPEGQVKDGDIVDYTRKKDRKKKRKRDESGSRVDHEG